jgi:nickel-dependent lactate racemase
VPLAGASVWVNAAFAQADLRVAVCGVAPHPFAGFSGGGKIVIPGLADLDTLARTHKFALMGMHGGATLDTNRFRTEMERAVRAIGLHWTANVVVNRQRGIAAIVAGDLVDSHRAAAREAARLAETARPSAPLDALVLNAYPKDSELLQIEAAFVALRSGMLRWLAPGAPVVLAAACPGGVGHHALFQRGGKLFRTPAKKTFLADHPLIVFCPTVDEQQVRDLFWQGYPHCQSWGDVVRELESRVPQHARIGVVPCGPQQLARVEAPASR